MQESTRICPRCSESKSLTDWGKGQSYCRGCFSDYKRARRAARVAALPTRHCSECGAAFQSAYVQTVTCSAICGTAREWRKSGAQVKIADIAPANCAECGIEFTMKNTSGKFCSPLCKSTARNRRRIGNRNRKSVSLLARMGPEAYAEFTAAARVRYAESNKASKLRWALANKDRVKAAAKARNAAYPEVANERTRKYRASKRAAFTVPFSAEALAQKLAYWGNSCWMCGTDATAVDHVKPLIKQGAHVLANFRPACGPCNSSKGGRWFGVSELHRFMK